MDGELPQKHLDVLLQMAMAEQPSRVLEVGTFMGSTTAALAKCLPYSEIHTVDLPPGARVPNLPGKDPHLVLVRDVGREYRNLSCCGRIVQHYRNTLEWDFAEAGNPDFVFIDADHSYEGVKNDSEKLLARVPDGGMFVWHDYDPGHPGVRQLLDEWRSLGRDIRRVPETSIAYWRRD